MNLLGVADDRLFRVAPGSKVKLSDYDPAWAGTAEAKALCTDKLKDRARDRLEKLRRRLADTQEVLYADNRYAALVIFQALDAAGKDGTIKHVMSGVNPQGVQVFAFKQPSAEEVDHDFLWRYAKALPERGRIGIFNRSYYEEVLVTRVHPELLSPGALLAAERGKPDRSFWSRRFEDINGFERHLTRSGTLVLKFFLNVSKAEQKKRFLERLRNPEKHWKFSAADLRERAYWDDYVTAYEDALGATSTDWAPWYVIPADRKWVMRALVSAIMVAELEKLDLSFPLPTAAQRAEIAAGLKALKAEKD